MSEEGALGSLWGGLLWLAGGLALHVVNRYCGRVTNALAKARKVSSFEELSEAAESSRGRDPGLVAVVGRVNAEHPLTCRISKIPAVLVIETVEYVYLRQDSGSQWVRESYTATGTRQQTPWYLDVGSGRAYVESPAQASDFDKALTAMSVTIEEAPASNAIKAFVEVARGIRVLHVKRVEDALPVGTVLTVVGEVAKEDSGRVVLRRPKGLSPFYVSRRSLESLVASLGGISSACKAFSVACTVLGFACLVHFYLERRKEHYRRRHRPPFDSERRRAAGPNNGEGAAMQENAQQKDCCCIICLEITYNVVFFPCGHVCCCEGCSSGLSNCPLCRCRISQKKFVYLH